MVQMYSSTAVSVQECRRTATTARPTDRGFGARGDWREVTLMCRSRWYCAGFWMEPCDRKLLRNLKVEQLRAREQSPEINRGLMGAGGARANRRWWSSSFCSSFWAGRTTHMNTHSCSVCKQESPETCAGLARRKGAKGVLFRCRGTKRLFTRLSGAPASGRRPTAP